MPANVEKMMYAGQVPWHGLGTYVGEEPVTSEEAIKLASLNWGVEKRPLFYYQERMATTSTGNMGTSPTLHAAGDWYGTVRTSDQSLLGVVTKSYRVVQNSEAFVFMDTLVEEGKVRYNTAGSLADGKRIWLLAELPDSAIEVVPKDVVQPYVLLSNGHDGKSDLHIIWTSVRVVCQNTLHMAFMENRAAMAPKFSIRHTGDPSLKMDKAREILMLTKSRIAKFEEFMKSLAAKPMADQMFDEFLLTLIPDPPLEVSPTRAKNARDLIRTIYVSGPGSDIPGVLGSQWGALQAVTDFTTHHRATRGSGKGSSEQEKRLESVWFGSGATLNNKALQILVDT